MPSGVVITVAHVAINKFLRGSYISLYGSISHVAPLGAGLEKFSPAQHVFRC